jgi:hypothetical protein
VPVADAGGRERFAEALASGALIEDADGLRFASETALVEAATQQMIETERGHLLANPKACFERLDEIFGNEIGKEQMVCGRVLAALHNSGELDAFSWARLAIEAGVGVFDVLRVLESTVSLLDDAKADSVFEFFCGHYEKTKNDLARGLIYGKLDPWLIGHPNVARGLMQLHETQATERSGSLYACALSALMNHDFVVAHGLALAAAQAPDPLISGPSMHSLGLAKYDMPERRSALERSIELCARTFRVGNHPNLETAVATLTRLVPFDEPTVVELLDEAGKTGVPLALYPISTLLWTQDKEHASKPWFRRLLMHLTAARPEHGGILRNIDFVLMRWVRDPALLPLATEFINAWIASQPREIVQQVNIADAFQSAIHRIAEIPAALNQMLTLWLIHEDQRYPLIASKLVSRLRTEGLTALSLDKATLDDLDEAGFRFLVRRMLGYLSGDEVLIKLVFSLARTHDAKSRTFGFIRAMLQQHVGYDYPHQTVEYMKERTADAGESAEIRALADEMAKTLQDQLDTLDALPVLKEFMPPSEKTKRFSKERHRQMNEAMEEASKDSIWRKIATNIPLKAGRRTFQAIQGRYTDVTELKSMSHSVALPRSEICDPAGSARERLLMRRAKRGTP